MAKIEEELFGSGQVVMTSAVGGQGSMDDQVYETRDLRDSEYGDEFKEGTLAGKGQLIGPELSISGKIFQRNISYDRRTQQVEYYFQLMVTDLASGLRFWQKETVIGKRGSSKSVAW
jgi:PBP1b-binding outer membrane lipoprotein LpoB